jgi:trehalose utilization protein
MSDPIRVTVWGENAHEQDDLAVQKIYPDGMHETIAAGLRAKLGDNVRVRTAWLQQPEHGLTEEVLADTDVLTWWGHRAHGEVADEVVERVHQAVLSGMGLIALHSAHFSKIFKRLMGTTCSLDWRSDNDRELLWTVAPGHPIAAGVPHPLVIEREEMYGELFDVPQPDELVFISSFSGGEVFRSGCCYRRGQGRVFYFRPGDQEFPTYHQPEIQQVIANAVGWAAPVVERALPNVHHRATPGWFEAPTEG